jgi:hypothetical protein
LTTAESRVVAAALAGEPVDLSQDDAKVPIRASVVCDLLSGTWDGRPVDPRGVRVTGARLTGEVDLSWRTLAVPLALDGCDIDEPILLLSTHAPAISLRRCHLTSISADRLQVEGDFVVGDSVVRRDIRMIGADIGGTLRLSGTTITAVASREAFFGSRMRVGGTAFLNRGFVALGEVRIADAHIGNTLTFRRAAVVGSKRRVYGDELGDEGDGAATPRTSEDRPRAISASRITVGGSLFLNLGFSSVGVVRLTGASVGGQLSCNRGRFSCEDGEALGLTGVNVQRNVLLRRAVVLGAILAWRCRIGGDLDLRRATLVNRGKVVLSLNGAHIAGSVILRTIPRPIEGKVEMLGTFAGQVDDDPSAWSRLDGDIDLRGLTYDLITEPEHVPVADRITWLEHQVPFSPQPYAQLASTYRANGRAAEAADIQIARERRSRHNLPRRSPRRWWNAFLAVSVGHGRRPFRPIIAVLAAFAIASLVFWAAGTREAMVSTAEEGAARSDRCTSESACFFAPQYVLSSLLPFVELGQTDDWRPDQSRPWGWSLEALRVTLVLLGWISSTALLAGLAAVYADDR